MKFSSKILIFLAAVPLVAVATKPMPFSGFEDWEWDARISTPAEVQSKYVVLDLTPEVFSHLKPDLSDLRIGTMVGEGQQIPYVLNVERETESFAKVSGRVFNVSSVAGETTSFVVDLGGKGIFHNAVTIETASENFRKIVEVQGSDDETSWRVLTSRGPIFDYTIRDPRYIHARDTDVVYPDTTYRYLLVKIFDHDGVPIKVSGAKVFRKVQEPAHEVSYNPAIEIQENRKDQSTDVIADLGVAGIPHRKVRISAAPSNFHRAVAVYESDDRVSWRFLSHAYIFDIRTERFQGNSLEFVYPESNRRYVKFAILNRDDASIQVERITLFGVVRRILFPYDARQGGYYLFAGNPNAARPQYDLGLIAQYVDPATLDRVSAGPVERNPNYRSPQKPVTERSPYLLPTLLGLVVAILAFLLLRMMTRAKAS